MTCFMRFIDKAINFILLGDLVEVEDTQHPGHFKLQREGREHLPDFLRQLARKRQMQESSILAARALRSSVASIPLRSVLHDDYDDTDATVKIRTSPVLVFDSVNHESSECFPQEIPTFSQFWERLKDAVTEFVDIMNFGRDSRESDVVPQSSPLRVNLQPPPTVITRKQYNSTLSRRHTRFARVSMDETVAQSLPSPGAGPSLLYMSQSNQPDLQSLLTQRDKQGQASEGNYGSNDTFSASSLSCSRLPTDCKTNLFNPFVFEDDSTPLISRDTPDDFQEVPQEIVEKELAAEEAVASNSVHLQQPAAEPCEHVVDTGLDKETTTYFASCCPPSDDVVEDLTDDIESMLKLYEWAESFNSAQNDTSHLSKTEPKTTNDLVLPPQYTQEEMNEFLSHLDTWSSIEQLDSATNSNVDHNDTDCAQTFSSVELFSDTSSDESICTKSSVVNDTSHNVDQNVESDLSANFNEEVLQLPMLIDIEDLHESLCNLFGKSDSFCETCAADKKTDDTEIITDDGDTQSNDHVEEYSPAISPTISEVELSIDDDVVISAPSVTSNVTEMEAASDKSVSPIETLADSNLASLAESITSGLEFCVSNEKEAEVNTSASCALSDSDDDDWIKISDKSKSPKSAIQKKKSSTSTSSNIAAPAVSDTTTASESPTKAQVQQSSYLSSFWPSWTYRS